MADHNEALTGRHAESGPVSTPGVKPFPPAHKAGDFPPGKKFRPLTIISSQTSAHSDSPSNRSISAFCEECFYCPECSDNSDCDSCFDQESCVDCLEVCKDCNEMDPFFSFPSAAQNLRRNCGEWTSNWSHLSTGVEASGLDLSGGQPVHTGYTADQKAVQESTFDQYVDYSASEGPAVQDSIAASAASAASLPVEGLYSSTTELYEVIITNCTCRATDYRPRTHCRSWCFCCFRLPVRRRLCP